MDTLVALGTSAAYFYSAWVTFFPDSVAAAGHEPAVYYDTAVMIITFILLGRWLEARTRGRASEALRRLFALAPPTARVRRGDTEQEVPLAQVAGGRPGGGAPRGKDPRGRRRGRRLEQRRRIHAHRRKYARAQGTRGPKSGGPP